MILPSVFGLSDLRTEISTGGHVSETDMHFNSFVRCCLLFNYACFLSLEVKSIDFELLGEETKSLDPRLYLFLWNLDGSDEDTSLFDISPSAALPKC